MSANDEQAKVIITSGLHRPERLHDPQPKVNGQRSLTPENGNRPNHRGSRRALDYGIDLVREMQQESSEQSEEDQRRRWLGL
jgi:hypothetical protein